MAVTTLTTLQAHPFPRQRFIAMGWTADVIEYFWLADLNAQEMRDFVAGSSATISGSPAAGQYARFASSNQLEGRSPAQVLADINAAPSSHTHAAAEISDSTSAGRAMLTAASAAAQTALLDAVTAGTKGLAPASGGGTANFLRADGSWAAPPGLGDVTGSSASVDNEIALFSGTSGKALKRATTTGILKATSGIIGPAIPGTDYAAALTDLTDVTVSAPAAGQVLVRGASEWLNQTVLLVSIGPFYIHAIPASATTQATMDYFNTTITLNRSPNDQLMARAGQIIGISITSDAARTAGTATVQARVNGTETPFAGGAVVLDATRTTSNSSFVSPGSGVAFAANQTIGAAVVSAGWAPTTANCRLTLHVMLEPF